MATHLPDPPENIPEKVGNWKLVDYGENYFEYEHDTDVDRFGHPLRLKITYVITLLSDDTWWEIKPPAGFRGYKEKFSDRKQAVKYAINWMERHQDS